MSRSRLPLRRNPRTAFVPEVLRNAEPRVSEAKRGSLRWIHIEQPGLPEQAWLAEGFPHFHPLDLEDVLSKTQRPKLDEYDDYVFIVLHFPHWDRDQQRLSSGELDVFVGPDYVVTIASQRLRALGELFEEVSEPANNLRCRQVMGRGSGYLLYYIVDLLFDRCFPMLSKIGAKLDEAEEQIFADDHDEAEVVKKLSDLRQELITFRRTMRPQRELIKRLERTKERFGGDDELDYYFDDTSDAAGRIWDMLETFSETLAGLREAHESLASHRLNETLRVLTAISVIILPLTLIASVWGMNVRVPGENGPAAFIVILLAMAGLFGALWRLFRRRGWL